MTYTTHGAVSRRRLLGWGLAGAASLALGPRAGGAPVTAPGARKPWLRVSCSSLAYSDTDWETALRAMRDHGFRLVELAMFEGWAHVDPSRLMDPIAHGRRIARACDRAGVEPVAIHANFRPADAPRDFPGITTGDAGLRSEVIEHCRRVLLCARAAGIPLVNIQPGKLVEGLDRSTCLASAVAALGPMVETARRVGIALSFENHTGALGERPEDALALIERVPGLKLDFDLSHIVANSIALEAVRPLLPHVAHVAIRNATAGNYCLRVEGDRLAFDPRPYLDALRDAGYRGAIAVEYFQPDMREDNVRLFDILQRAGIPA